MSSRKINTIRNLKIYSEDHTEIKALLESAEDAPEIHGDKVWFSSYFIMDYLLENPTIKTAKTMEIGCGWGLLSIFCASQFSSQVIAVDADQYVFAFLNLHAEKNNVQIENKVCRYEDLSVEILEKQDLILGGDICFWEELIDPLLSLIQTVMKKKEAKIILADPGRGPFLKLAKLCEKEFKTELIEVSIDDPSEEEGYLLIISN